MPTKRWPPERKKGYAAQGIGGKSSTCTMAKPDGPVTIKKYANRRLYNTGTSTYVTLEDLATMVKAGDDFLVHDAKTGEDITRQVLAQIIFEQENKEGQSLLPIAFLRQLIRFYGDSMQMLVPRYLEVSIDSLTREQSKFRDQYGIVRANFCDVHAIRAARGPGGGGARQGRPGGGRRGRWRRRDRRPQASDGRDAEASRQAQRQGQDVAP
jgi:polyhydroxyalkanoate synthesis repressor PhaR